MDALGPQSRGFFWVISKRVVPTHNSSTFIRLTCNPWFIMFLYVHKCSYYIISISPSPRSPRTHGVKKHVEASPRISADIPMKSSVRPSLFFVPHPACNEHPDWGRSHGVGFSFHWLEILNPRGVVVVVVHGCFSHGFAAPLAISISCWYVGSVKNWKPTLHRNPTVGHVFVRIWLILHIWGHGVPVHQWGHGQGHPVTIGTPKIEGFICVSSFCTWTCGNLESLVGKPMWAQVKIWKPPACFCGIRTDWLIVRVHWYPCPYNEVN